jgi:DNA-binding MarR family transcriptional regulator
VAGVDVMATNTNLDPAPQNDDAQPYEGRSLQNDPALDFVLVKEIQPPRRIDLARERMLMCRLYLGLIRTMSDDYGAEFAGHSDSATYRTIGIYVFLRTTMCSPARASTIAHALRIPRAIVLRRLQEMVKHGYVERVGNAYRVTDKVNIPDLSKKISRRIDMIIETARELSALDKRHESNPPERSFEPDHPSGGA